MPTAVISTTGTSVFSQAGKAIQEESQAFGKRSNVDLQKICQGVRDFDGYDLYDRTLQYLRGESSTRDAENAIRKASAELNSLSHILSKTSRDRRNDQLHFLASDTPEGALAARIVADFAKEYFDVETSKVHLINGLQVADGRKFQLDGIRVLIATIYDILKNAPAGTFTRVINPTGGFKGVVPYLTLIGMIEPDIEMSYIYERSAELITLGRIPLQFDFDVLESAYPALKKCDEDFVAESELKELLALDPARPLSTHPAWAFFDPMEQNGERQFLINGLGRIALQHFASLDRPKVYLSKQASERFKELDKAQKDRFARYFDNLRNPQWLDQKRHDEYQNPGGAICVKPGDVNERLWCYKLEDGGVLVAELAFHRPGGSYDRVPQRRKDYDTHRIWEGKL
jgi:putative CRISPR-associated protein (TIGR02619 family)